MWISPTSSQRSNVSNDPANDDDCTIPPVMSIEAQAKYVMPQPAHKARDIAEYVELEADDEKVVHCELVKRNSYQAQGMMCGTSTRTRTAGG